MALGQLLSQMLAGAVVVVQTFMLQTKVRQMLNLLRQAQMLLLLGTVQRRLVLTVLLRVIMQQRMLQMVLLWAKTHLLTQVVVKALQ